MTSPTRIRAASRSRVTAKPKGPRVASGYRKYRNVPTEVDGTFFTANDEARFWLKVDKRTPEECWPWQAGTFRHGYGQFGFGGRVSLRKMGAHRVALVLSGRSLSATDIVLHACDRPSCCNPAHLQVGTQADNLRDARRKRRTAFGERSGRAKLNDADVGDIRRLRGQGKKYREIAELFGVTSSLVGYICRRKIWGHLA